jgi:hypothetical protein
MKAVRIRVKNINASFASTINGSYVKARASIVVEVGVANFPASREHMYVQYLCGLQAISIRPPR